ncbi:MAG: phosphatase PAP2 family protein [Bacteroidales bacterium]|nr:phosphatase PAP2 family protein [Bacteroidales bacterium]
MKRLILVLSALALGFVAFAQDLDDTWNYPPLLSAKDAPDSYFILPEAPLPNDAIFAYDYSQYLWGKLQRNTPRGEQAAEDAKLDIDHVLANFSPCMGAVLSRTTTPTIAHMLAGLVNLEATTTAKDHYMRVRPFVLFNEPSLTPDDEPYLRGNGSYPSGHACFGWAVALILAEINPDRQNEIFKYGYEFGQSRVICGVHFQSDVDAGRLMGAATVARLHADKDFMKTLEKAKKEFNKVARKYPIK